MNEYYIVYNPSAGDGTCKAEAEILYVVYPDAILVNMNRIIDYRVFLSGMDESDKLILCGGDGTLSWFINKTRDIEIRSEIYFYSVGNGNDFAQDIGRERGATPDFTINSYIKDFPIVKINGEQRLFINGIGYGMDGFCMRAPDAEQRSRRQNRFSSKMDATIGFLFHYKPIDLLAQVDGNTQHYKNVWFAHTMKGGCLGGVMIVPQQNRLEDEEISFVVLHGIGRWKALRLFLSMINGKCVKGKKGIEVIRGKHVQVAFGEKVSVQVDGGMVDNVEEYAIDSQRNRRD